jgi:hypothetical protein
MNVSGSSGTPHLATVPVYESHWQRATHDPGSSNTIPGHSASLILGGLFLAYGIYDINKHRKHPGQHTFDNIMDGIAIALAALTMSYDILRIGVAVKYRKNRVDKAPTAPQHPTLYNEHTLTR